MTTDPLAQLLFDHAKECDSLGCEVCECGWTSPDPAGPDMDQRYYAHVADAIRDAGWSDTHLHRCPPTADDQPEGDAA